MNRHVGMQLVVAASVFQKAPDAQPAVNHILALGQSLVTRDYDSSSTCRVLTAHLAAAAAAAACRIQF